MTMAMVCFIRMRVQPNRSLRSSWMRMTCFLVGENSLHDVFAHKYCKQSWWLVAENNDDIIRTCAGEKGASRTIIEDNARLFSKDLNWPWEDSMSDTGESHLAQELRGVGISTSDMFDWEWMMLLEKHQISDNSQSSQFRNKGRGFLSTIWIRNWFT